MRVGPSLGRVSVGAIRINLRDRRSNRGGDLVSFFGVLVFAPRPEETFKSVSLAARHYVHVKMGDALTDDIVHGDEGALCFHGSLNGFGEQSNVEENGLDEGGREIGDGDEVALGDQEAMAREEWPVIQEGDGVFVLEDADARCLAEDDAAEGAATLSCGHFIGMSEEKES
jgi:hypothetical protein